MGLFSPKWKHPDPEVRRTAVSKLTKPGTLQKLAENPDEEQDIRLLAVANLYDTETLIELARIEDDVVVAEAALERLTKEESLISVAAKPGLEKIGKKAIDRISQKGLAEVLRQSQGFRSQDHAIRDYAGEKIEDQELLLSFLDAEPWTGLPTLAVAKLQDQHLLAKVAAETTEQNETRCVAINRLQDIAQLRKLFNDSQQYVRNTAQARALDLCIERLKNSMNHEQFAVEVEKVLDFTLREAPMQTCRLAGGLNRMGALAKPEVAALMGKPLRLVVEDIRRLAESDEYKPKYLQRQFSSDDGVFGIALFGALARDKVAELQGLLESFQQDYDRIRLFSALACISDQADDYLGDLLRHMYEANAGHPTDGGGFAGIAGLGGMLGYMQNWAAGSPAAISQEMIARAMQVSPEQIGAALRRLAKQYPEEVEKLKTADEA